MIFSKLDKLNNEDLVNLLRTSNNEKIIKIIDYLYGHDLKTKVKIMLYRNPQNLLDWGDIYYEFLFTIPRMLTNYKISENATLRTFLLKSIEFFSLNKFKYWNCKKRSPNFISTPADELFYVYDVSASEKLDKILGELDLKIFTEKVLKNSKNVKLIHKLRNTRYVNLLTATKLNSYQYNIGKMFSTYCK
ncbi:hypothetical protein [Mycoplasma sp. HS2188]|uniref:hypothetical protein n=1 Tax=Mycoplasma sp. HS2188 TaxID=2976765 RepID=UPI0021AABA9E|nr:hypothetical protein [Mycoplasma sp. HS2188]MCT4469624.1 hypothetical protein [Mycoplasma sp. HS2188]